MRVERWQGEERPEAYYEGLDFGFDLVVATLASDREKALRAALERAADVLTHFKDYEAAGFSHAECYGEPGRHEPLYIEAALARAALHGEETPT